MVSLKTAVRTRRLKSVAIRVAALCVLLLVLGFAVFVRSLPSEPVPLTRNADGIVVLTGGNSRVIEALELLAAHRGKRLLITGVNPGTTTADIAHQTSTTIGFCLLRRPRLFGHQHIRKCGSDAAVGRQARFRFVDRCHLDLSYATRVGRTRASIAQTSR